MSFEEINLPSGNVLKVQVGSFAESKALYQALLEELKGIEFNSQTEQLELFKELACAGFSSKKIDTALEACSRRCLYSAGGVDMKIDKDTFEPVDRRGDYIVVVVEVLRANVAPFLTGLFAQLKTFTDGIAKTQTLK